MKQADREKFMVLINALASTFEREADKALLHGYWLGLRDLPLQSVEAACARALRSCTFFPRPHELRTLAGSPDPKIAAANVWPLVAKYARCSGRGADLNDSVADSVIAQMGGWKRLGQMEAEKFAVWGRKEFERLYQLEAAKPEVSRKIEAPRQSKIEGQVRETVKTLVKGMSA